MERRRNTRFESNEPAVVSELSPHAHRPMGGMIRDLSEDGMLIKVPRSVACGGLIRVETSRALLLGQVVRCEPDGEGFDVAMTIRHSFLDLPDLTNLNTALLSHDVAVPEPDAVPVPPIMRE